MPCCSTCGQTPCGCNSCGNPSLNFGIQDPLSCGGSNQGPGCCQNVLPGNPTPFYAGSSACEQDHSKKIFIQQFSASIKVSDAWNIPACNLSATITVSGLASITIGSYIWNPNFGYFLITAFNSATNQITVTNLCSDGNAAAGTFIPSCTDFTVTTPPIITNNPSEFPFLAVNFTAPNNGDCTNITVTNVNGLEPGNNIEVAGGTYLLQEIINTTTITICNEGQGLPPGTIVYALDAGGNYQYPIVTPGIDPCSSNTVIEGSILVCNSGLQVPLTSTNPPVAGGGLIISPTLQNQSTGDAVYSTIDASYRLCTSLTQILTIVNGVSVYNAVNVSTTNSFAINDIVEIQSLPALRFTITGFGVGTSFNLTSTTVPVSTATVPIGDWVCLITCCEDLQDQVNNINSTITGLAAAQASASYVPVTTGTINFATPSKTTPTATIINYTNPSASNNAYVSVFSNAFLQGAAIGFQSNGPGGVILQIWISINGGAAFLAAVTETAYFPNGDDALFSVLTVNWNYVATIAPAANLTITSYLVALVDVITGPSFHIGEEDDPVAPFVGLGGSYGYLRLTV